MQRLRAVPREGVSAAGLMLLLCLFAAGLIGASGGEDRLPVQLRNLTLADVETSTGGGVDALLVPGGVSRETAARLQFTLPPTDPTQARWVLWLGRDPVDAIWLQGRAADGSPWRSVTHDFFRPAPGQGGAPAGFVFALPTTWQGEIELELHARGGVRSALRPRLLREDSAMRRAQRAIALNAAIYASLFVFALIALVLYPAVRERSFLVLFGCAAAGLMLLAACNGHLFLLPGFSVLAAWRGQAIWALVLLFSATLIQLLLRYAEFDERATPAARHYDRYCLVLVALAALCLLDLQTLAAWMYPLTTAGWIGAYIVAMAIVIDAVRRPVPMAWSILLLLLLTFGAALATEAMARGYLPDILWTRYGYQLALVVMLATIALALLGRISRYRDQGDRDHLALVDTERLLHREAARAELTLALQTQLRSPSAGDIDSNAFRLLLDHLLRQVVVDSAAVIAHGYHGREALLVEPPDQSSLHDSLRTRTLMLKRQAASGALLQRPLTGTTGGESSGTEALVPLPIHAPGWGLLLLHRNGSQGFSTEELTLAGEFARLTVLYADEVLAANQLRRSAELDALTGTHNRRTIDQALARNFVEAHRTGHPLSLLFIDIDHFKGINDRYGHACGDHCLREIAAALRTALGEGDLLGRYGGEEFIAVLPGRDGAEARAIAERLRTAVEGCPINWQGQALRLTVSLGMATRLPHEQTPAATVERADKALYAAKRDGRNCVHVAPAVFT